LTSGTLIVGESLLLFCIETTIYTSVWHMRCADHQRSATTPMNCLCRHGRPA